ncbi:NAD(P)-binding domain-containing protein [Falsiroseomonas oryziterrae]|uniref:NAD(P)-binding domain-containing protein n=1 Tax=Falsiroseomonas oryziterrae TaxID=2911368 RepID=UPI001F25AC9C|nr:NAD(P)-binding domain-containing protein [Roseomonas sp. NPKOSM-4]
MRSIDAIVVGGGQAGLAASHELARFGVAHVVLERGRLAERWRSERWDSLRLLTPNWMNRLPGHAYRGPDPDGFMTMPEVVGFLDSYARSFAAPVEEATAVRALRPFVGGYLLETSRGTWRARAVIIATGHCGLPAVPRFAAALCPSVVQLTPSAYRNPGALPDGGVLVVGAAASALQIAEELRLSGRPVVLAAGRHTRAPRSYRGRDIWWWMDRAGMLEDRAEDQPDLARARAQPSLQLVGGPPPRDLDLPTLRALGVRVVGRMRGAAGRVVQFAGDLAENVAGAQRPLESMLARIDPLADAIGAPRERWPSMPRGFGAGAAVLDLGAERIRSIVWATGYRRDTVWLHVPGLVDETGELRHRGGVTPSPGLYVIGLRFLRRRSSNFIGGVGADATALAADAAGYLAARRPLPRNAA